MLSITATQRDRDLANARTEATVIAQIVEDQFVQSIVTTEQLMRWMAHYPELAGDDAPICQARLAQLLAETEAYRSFSVARPTGEVFCHATINEAAALPNLAELPFFQRTREASSFTGSFTVEPETGQPIFAFGYPILDSLGDVRAVISAELDAEKIIRAVIATRVPAYATLLIINRDGAVLVSDPELDNTSGIDYARAPLVQSILQRGEGSELNAGLDGVTRLYAFTSFGAADQPEFHIIVGLPSAYIYAGVAGMLRTSLLGLGGIGLAALLAAWFSAEWMIVRRARKIVDAASRLREGDLTARTGLSHDTSELGELAGTFDTMADALQARQLENMRLIHETQALNQALEQRVADRMAQLQTSHAALLESQDELRTLSQQLMDVTEQERTRIAREIHDQLGQALTVIKIELLTAQRRLAPNQSDLRQTLDDVTGLVDEMIQIVRRIATDMRPGILDDFGLEAAAEWQLEEFEKRTGLHCDLEADLDERQLDAPRCTASFRILQEALTNIARHAHATAVHVSLQTNVDHLILKVQDNGRGITPNELHRSKSLGLLGMRERAIQFGGRLEIVGVAGAGTTVTLTLPLHTNGEARTVDQGARQH